MGQISSIRRKLLRLAATVTTAILSSLGLSGCGSPAEPTYGVPGFSFEVTGSTRSASDSSIIQGISVRLDRVLPGDTSAIDSLVTESDGFYHLGWFEQGDTLPDGFALRLSAVDSDTAWHGSYGAVDTVIPVTGDTLLDLDLYLPRS